MFSVGHEAQEKLHFYHLYQPYSILIIVRYEKAGVIGLLDNAGHLILAQVRLREQTMREQE